MVLNKKLRKEKEKLTEAKEERKKKVWKEKNSSTRWKGKIGLSATWTQLEFRMQSFCFEIEFALAQESLVSASALVRMT